LRLSMISNTRRKCIACSKWKRKQKGLLTKKHRLTRTDGTVGSAVLGYGSATRKGIPDPRSNDANYVLSEKFEIN
ncbi:MAG: hypothetical protein ACKPKO_12775, partial [Candidatus Fonsibacter sp.]